MTATADTTATTNTVEFDCDYYADGRPVTIEDMDWFHVFTDQINVKVTLPFIKRNVQFVKSRPARPTFMLVPSYTRNEWQLVARYQPQANGKANPNNRVLTTFAHGSELEKLMDTHRGSHTSGHPHKSFWGVDSVDLDTGTFTFHINDTEMWGLPYETIRAAEELLESFGVNRQ